MFFNKNRVYIISICLTTVSLSANISGTVFQDLPVNGSTLNVYGVKDSNELGVKGITVTAYPDNISTVTDSNGSWSLATTVNSRVEFSNLPSYLKESSNAQVENSSVRFVTNGSSNINFGVYNPDDFSDTANPLYVNNLQQNGSHMGSTFQSLQTVHYNATGLNANFQNHYHEYGTGEVPLDKITMEDIGSVWGKAYQKDKKRLFVASMLQRHVGFAHSPADIYVISYASGIPPSLVGNFSLQGRVPSNGGDVIDLGFVDRSSGTDYFLYPDPAKLNIDLDAYAKVGKISYGGVDIDHEHSKLWLVNLNQKGLISVDISGDFNSLSSSTINQYLIEKLPNHPTCTGGYLRPWALKIHEGKGYLGAICDANISKNINDMNAFILSFDLEKPELGFSKVLEFSLNYPRQLKKWHAWEDSYFDPKHPKTYNGQIYGEPILSDIEFDRYNNMYLAFFDRYSTQLGNNNYRAISGTTELEGSYEYGEVLRICNINGIYEKEGTGDCNKSNYNDLNIAEFFNDQGGDRNREASLGSLAQLKGSDEILLTILDPHPEETTGKKKTKEYWFTQGEETLSLSDGSIKNWYANAYTRGAGLNGKANGIGDIELITAEAPIEIGDRVWLDSNGNGIQDANESGLANVKVEFVCGDEVKSTAVTDANGTYIFSNDANKVSADSYKYGVYDLKPKSTNCMIRVPNISGVNKQSSLVNTVLTIANYGEGNNSTINDSNGIINGDSAESNITVETIPVSGANNHSFDFGFKPVGSWSGRVSEDTDNDNIGDKSLSGVTIQLFNDTDRDGQPDGVVIATVDTNGSGEYRFENILVGNYVAIEVQPAGFSNIMENEGGDDNDMPDNNTTNSIAGVVTLGEDDSGNDFIERAISNVVPQVGGGGVSSGGYFSDSLGGDFSSEEEPDLLESEGDATDDNITIGDRVWLDVDKDGIQDRIEEGVSNILVSLYQSDCTTLIDTNITDSNGYYRFEYLDKGSYCIKFSNIPSEYGVTEPNIGFDDLKDSDVNPTTMRIENIVSTQWGSDTNLSFDLGLIPLHYNQNENNCSLEVYDDIVEANTNSRITTIDILSNDCESVDINSILFLDTQEGKSLWERGDILGDANITTVGTRLVVDGEGVWSIENGVMIFTANRDFDGKTPSPVYYIAQSEDGVKGNVARVSIETPCSCKSYKSSIPTFNIIGSLILILLTSFVTLFFFRGDDFRQNLQI